MEKQIRDKIFDEERSLYNLKDTEVLNCKFEGPADGESVLKECRNIDVKNCSFSLRYPMWHAKDFMLKDSFMDDKTRAPLWYDENGVMDGCNITGVKCLRECRNITVNNCEIDSPEFGWRCNELYISDSTINSVYFLFECKNVQINNLNMSGKYSFQYTENLHLKNCQLDTKDAFWHGRNIAVEDSIVKGEYLGWFSDNLTFINCKIIGTQPLCYCKNLRLINCTTENTDLSFEYSDVEADIKGHIISVKNPKSGTVTVDSIDEIIMEDAVTECCGLVKLRENSQVCK